MSHEEKQDNRPSEQEEELGETFLKELYTYMKKRNTPIERIPHLGFKQIDLFMMYKTVKSFGGYHQVTAQQMWKQVYNILGGNPRSTSAATCTRRHYEKLLLPYECHIRGGDYTDALPPRQQKRLHSSEEDECSRTAKCSMTSLHQSHHTFLTDSRLRIIPIPYHHYYHHLGHPMETSQSQYVHPELTSSSQPGPQSSYLTSTQGQAQSAKQPLERLRFLADRYKCTSGWTEPLNLSRKRSGLESGIHPASSFTPPPSNKSPKFLNTPSPLYPVKGLAKDEGCEPGEGESPPGRSYHYPVAVRDDYIIDLTSSSSGGSSSSPTPAYSTRMKTVSPVRNLLQNRRASTPSMANVPKQPKREYPDWSTGVMRGESPKNSLEPLNLSSNLLCPPTETEGRMEIQIPLALLQDLIKGGLLCGPSGSRHGALSLKCPTLPDPTLGQTTGLETTERDLAWSDNSPAMATHADQVSHSHHRNLDRDSGKSLEKHKNLPRLLSSPCLPMEPYQFSSHKPQPSDSILCNTDSQDLCPWKEQDASRRPYRPKPIHPQDLQDRAKPVPLNRHPNSQTMRQDGVGSTSLGYGLDVSQGRAENPGIALMVNPTIPSLGPLTTEEFIKLKRLISSSL
ncbi:AT-rich interaction domain 6 [Esox lucius]|uniref:ARID domain-containing protein n=1 Tax=Esox lucius TaxID=8010 RepID=A0AAY5K235_ESOLU|nr:AT-rich interaction domain 6 [Esox lucius]